MSSIMLFDVGQRGWALTGPYYSTHENRTASCCLSSAKKRVSRCTRYTWQRLHEKCSNLVHIYIFTPKYKFPSALSMPCIPYKTSIIATLCELYPQKIHIFIVPQTGDLSSFTAIVWCWCILHVYIYVCVFFFQRVEFHSVPLPMFTATDGRYWRTWRFHRDKDRDV